MTTTINGKATELITFSRGSLATVTDSDGRIKWAPHNLLSASEQFDVATWEKTSVTVTANYAAAPNGTTTADRAVYAGSVGSPDTRQIRQPVSVSTSGVSFTFGIWVSGTGKFRLQNVHGGVLATYSSNITATATPTLYTLAVTNGTGAGTGFQVVGIVAATDDTAFDLNLWGAHLYRSDLGGMQANASAYPMYNPSTPRNLLGWSEAFDNAYWSKNRVTAPKSSVPGPFGFGTANLITDNNVSGTHNFQVGVVVPNSASVTFSAYFKKGTAQYAGLWLNDNGTVNSRVIINLDTGARTAFGSNSTANGRQYISSSSTAVGDGWYRVSLTVVGANNDTTVYCMASFSVDGTELGPPSYVGTGSTFYLWGAQLSDSASLDPYVGSYGAAPSAAAAHGPRLDYDPVTLAARGLLVEEQRANVAQYSADLSSWFSEGGVTFSSNVTAAPDGTTTADKIVTANSTAPMGAGPPTLVFSATKYTWSAYLKAGEITFAQFTFNTNISLEYANFNLSTGAVTAGTYDSASITPVGNGWYRCAITFTAQANAGRPFVLLISSGTAARSASIAGNGTNGLFVYGAQLEAGSFATSYIPTGASTVTRSADVASVATSAFPYSSTASSIVVNASLLAVNAGLQFVTALSDNTVNNRIALFNPSGSANINQITTTSGATQSSISTGSVSSGAIFKSGAAVTTNDAAAYLNGAAGTPDTSVTMPSAATVLYLGADEIGTARLNGHIRQITYIPRRLTNAELQARTA